MKRIGIFVDVNNVYANISRQYRNRKLSYAKYREFVEDFGDVIQAVAYGSQNNNEAAGFIRALKKAGYQTKYKNVGHMTDWNVGLTVDVVQMASRLDIVVLGSADESLEPLVGWCLRQGISVYVIACNTSNALKASATECIEIPESLLEDKRASSKTNWQ